MAAFLKLSALIFSGTFPQSLFFSVHLCHSYICQTSPASRLLRSLTVSTLVCVQHRELLDKQPDCWPWPQLLQEWLWTLDVLLHTHSSACVSRFIVLDGYAEWERGWHAGRITARFVHLSFPLWDFLTPWFLLGPSWFLSFPLLSHACPRLYTLPVRSWPAGEIAGICDSLVCPSLFCVQSNKPLPL